MDLGRLQGAWHQILEAVKNRRRFTWMVLTGSDVGPVGVEGNTVLLGFSRPNEAKGFTNSGSDQVVAGAIQEVLGVEVRVAAGGAGAGGPAAPTRRPEPARPAEPVAWEPPAPEPERPPAPAPATEPAPEPATPTGPPPEKVVTGLQEPPPDPFEDASAAPPPEDPDPGPPRRGPEPATHGQATPDTTEESGEDEAPGVSGVALIEEKLGGKLIEEIEHEAPGG